MRSPPVWLLGPLSCPLFWTLGVGGWLSQTLPQAGTGHPNCFPFASRSLGGDVASDGDFLIFEGNRYSRKGFLFKSFAMSAVVRGQRTEETLGRGAVRWGGEGGWRRGQIKLWESGTGV